MINGLYGNEMWVAEDRVEEYKAAGAKLAAEDSPSEEPQEKPKKTGKKAKAKK